MRVSAVAVVAIAAVAGGRAALAATCPTPPGAPTCPKAAAVAVYATNLSGDASVTLAVSGDLLTPSDACTGPGTLTQPEVPLTCTGSGAAPVLCGRLTGLRPGAWAFRIRTQVTGSAVQEQAQQLVLVGGDAPNVSNVVTWTVYPATFVVATADRSAIVGALDAAAAYTAAHPGPALVTFSHTAFPPMGSAVDVLPGCVSNTCQPGGDAALCITGDRIVVDGLDVNGAPGAVVLTVGVCQSRLVRLFGRDVVLRGLVFRGSQFDFHGPAPNGCTQVDTVDVLGATALRNRLERCVVEGPTCGDAVAVEESAGQPDADVMIVDSILRGAEDRGIKVSTGAYATLVSSCVADNGGGGVQATQGGHVIAVHNLVQRNLGTKNGMTARGNAAPQSSTLATDGNIVRLNGGRGVTVTDDAVGTFTNDIVSDNETAGGRVETSAPGPSPQATFSGVAFVCNQLQVPGRTAPDGFGAVTGYDADPMAPCASCASGSCPMGCDQPDVSFGSAPTPGRNAFTRNARTGMGADFHDDVPGSTVTAVGNQWDHEADPIAGGDVTAAAGATVLVTPIEAAFGGDPTLTDTFPKRPRRDQLVRVYGSHFDAIDGNDCANAGNLPSLTDGCDPQNCAVAAANVGTYGNRVRLHLGTTTYHPDVYAVSPTMLAFRMPVDCVAGAQLWVNTGPPDGMEGPAIDLCDPTGCQGRPADAPCDDGDPCTTGDHCNGDAATPQCVSGTSCGECASCDATQGCVPRTGACTDDGNPCTDDVCTTGTCTHPAGHPGAICRHAVGTCDAVETCDGTHVECPADAKRTDECRIALGSCDVAERCDGVGDECPPDAAAPVGTICRAAADACDVAERCDGAAQTCPDDAEVAGFDAISCRTDPLAAALGRCTGKKAPLVALLKQAERAMTAARSAPACRAVKRLRTTEERLRRLVRLLGRGRCASDVGPAPSDLARAALDRAGALRGNLACRR